MRPRNLAGFQHLGKRSIREIGRWGKQYIRPLAKVELTSSYEFRLIPPVSGGGNLTPSPFRGGMERGSWYFCKRSILQGVFIQTAFWLETEQRQKRQGMNFCPVAIFKY